MPCEDCIGEPGECQASGCRIAQSATPSLVELVRRGVIRNREAQDVERESYENALRTVRKYGP